MEKKEKKKPYRSAWSNAVWSFRGMLKDTPQSFWLMAASVPLAVFLAWAEIKLPALVVGEVTGKQTFLHAAVMTGFLLGAMLLATGAKEFCATVSASYLSRYRYGLSISLDEKAMRCFYETYEKKSTRDLQRRAQAATWMYDGRVKLWEMPKQSMDLVQNLLCYALLGTMLSFASPWLVLLLTVAPVINWFCVGAYNKYEYNTRPERTDLEKKQSYAAACAGNFKAAKDIRVYGMGEWLKGIYRDLSRQSVSWQQKLSLRQFLAKFADLFVIVLRDGISYGVLITMAVQGKLSAEEFVLYFAAISGFATYVGNIMTAWNEMHAASLVICDFREYMDLPEEGEEGRAQAKEHLKTAPEIVFDHVSFCYEGAGKDTLHDISFTIHPGERIALVGKNGAGKSTLVRLLCGLYRPVSGEIRVDDVPIRDFSSKEYYRLFSTVFQDVNTAFFSLAETVACSFGEEVDRKRAEACMRRAGLGAKLDRLPEGIDTKLDKQINEKGIELSGGELQKLMMARAFYKDAPILVLDEPTAALDPIAENEIYLQYRNMTEGKTSLFISHRLASTRFCDRILFLEEGRIAEEGTHEELIGLGGEYAKLYEMQSCWYREDYEGGREQ